MRALSYLAGVATVLLATTVFAAEPKPSTSTASTPMSAGSVPVKNLVVEGRRLFLASCAHCHGEDARGDDGPDLHGLEAGDRRIATVITRGIKGEMPSFAKKHGEADIAALIAYLRSLD